MQKQCGMHEQLGLIAAMQCATAKATGRTDRVHVPQVAAAIPEGVRQQERQRCIMCTSDKAALQQALSTCAYSSMASQEF